MILESILPQVPTVYLHKNLSENNNSIDIIDASSTCLAFYLPVSPWMGLYKIWAKTFCQLGFKTTTKIPITRICFSTSSYRLLDHQQKSNLRFLLNLRNMFLSTRSFIDSSNNLFFFLFVCSHQMFFFFKRQKTTSEIHFFEPFFPSLFLHLSLLDLFSILIWLLYF